MPEIWVKMRISRGVETDKHFENRNKPSVIRQKRECDLSALSSRQHNMEELNIELIP